MPINKGIMVKYRKQRAEDAGYYHHRWASTHRTDPLYDVFDQSNHLVEQSKTLTECASFGKGCKFVPRRAS